MKNFLTRPSPPATLQQLFMLLLLKSFETIFNTKISLKIVPSYTLEATRRRRRTHFFHLVRIKIWRISCKIMKSKIREKPLGHSLVNGILLLPPICS